MCPQPVAPAQGTGCFPPVLVVDSVSQGYLAVCMTLLGQSLKTICHPLQVPGWLIHSVPELPTVTDDQSVR